jgi:hypothetical protein
MTKPRKEKVLHTRVPAVLEEELKRLAQSLRVPVSNVVRTILQDAVETVDAVQGRAEDELRDVADRLHARRTRSRESAAPEPGATPEATPEAVPEAPSAPTPPLAGVIGYQPLLLARVEQCSLCGVDLAAGSQAYLGVREIAGPRVILGDECLPFSADRPSQPEE